jgi:hypothetical protein
VRSGAVPSWRRPPPTSCEDCIPETGQGSRLVDQVTTNLRKLRSKAGIEREELARRAAMSADEIALAEPGTKTKLSDTRLLCPNCHRLVHSKRPWLSWQELLDLVREG